jgi:hypothetical protein
MRHIKNIIEYSKNTNESTSYNRRDIFNCIDDALINLEDDFLIFRSIYPNKNNKLIVLIKSKEIGKLFSINEILTDINELISQLNGVQYSLSDIIYDENKSKQISIEGSSNLKKCTLVFNYLPRELKF